FQVVEAALRLHLAHINGEVGRRHLLFHHPLQSASAARGVERKTVFRVLVERTEKRDALNVVPVKMGDKDVCTYRLISRVALELLAQCAKSGTTVEDVEIVAQAHFDAGGVASVAQVVGLGSRRRSADAPELDPHTPPWQI